MKLFKGIGASQGFMDRLNKEAANLPIAGDAASPCSIALAHHSSDALIRSFRPRFHLYTWTDVLSQSASQLYRITGLSAATFVAVYVIRLGVSSSCSYMRHRFSGPNCSEYALDIAIPSSHFARIPITSTSGRIELQ